MISIGTPVSVPVNYSTWTYNKYGHITSFTTKSSVTSIGYEAFISCKSLTSVSMPTVTSIDGRAFDSCKSLTSVSMPSVNSIGDSAFWGCKSLTSVSMPNVVSIGYSAFGYCTSLTAIDIPSGVTSIGNYAFSSCSNLISVTCRATTPPTLANTVVFDGTSEDLVIYVPAESVEAYKVANNWSTYAYRIQAIPQ